MSEHVLSPGRIAEAQTYLKDRLILPEWDRLADVFETSLPPAGAPGRLSQLAELAKQWDSRNGAMRNEAGVGVHVAAALEQRGDEAIAAIYAAAQRLGNIGTTKTVKKGSDLTYIMGGGGDANMMRALFGYGLSPVTAYLGSERKIGLNERAKLARYAPELAEKQVLREADVMMGVIGKLHPDREEMYRDERLVAYEAPEGRIFWLCALPRNGREIANTDDTLRFLDDELGAEGETAVGVTNDIYREFQHVSGLIEMRATVQTTGFTPQHGVQLMRAAGLDEQQELKPASRLPSTYLQEIKSAVDKYVILDGKIAGTDAGHIA